MPFGASEGRRDRTSDGGTTSVSTIEYTVVSQSSGSGAASLLMPGAGAAGVGLRATGRRAGAGATAAGASITSTGGVAVGLSLSAAVEFSFLLGLLTLGAATAYKALDSGAVMLQTYGPGVLLAGFVAAWVSAMLSVAWMVAWLQHRRLTVFGWWRLAAAAVVVALVMAQRI